jgi:hypothetical protein
MATENRRRLREPRAESDPLQTGARQRLTNSSAGLDRDALGVGEADADVGAPSRVLARASRPSIRPSAFGIPRNRSSDPNSDPSTATTAVERLSSPAARPSSMPAAATSEPPRVSHTVRKREAPERPAVKTDIEELLPISQGVKSLPRPPKLPTFEAPQLPAPTQRRFPWMSLSIFAVVLGASLAPLMRYSGERTSSMVSHELASLREVDWGSLPPLAHGIERTLWDQPAALRDQLLDEGEHALSVGDPAAAEGAFVQALAYGIDDPSAAFGLARVRLAQGDLLGARGWAETALRRRPQDARLRSFLERLPAPRRAR